MASNPESSLPRKLANVARVTVKRTIFALGTVSLIAICASMVTEAYVSSHLGRKIPPKFVLSLDLSKPVSDSTPLPPVLRRLTGASPTLFEIVTKLKLAETDPRVTGVTLHIEGDCCDYSTAQELHSSLTEFRNATKKPVLVYANSFGEDVNGTPAYLAAAAADKITMLGDGVFNVAGIAISEFYASTALQKYGIQPYFYHRGMYKSAPEMYTNSGPSPAHSENMTDLADNLYQQAVVTIAADRHLAPDIVRAAIDNAPLTPVAAKQQGLIDAYVDDPDTAINAPDGTPNLDIGDYVAPSVQTKAQSASAALIIASGEISGPGQTSQTGISPDRLIEQIDTATKNKAIAALILRLNSPGGSASASSLISAAVERFKATHRPVIVSIGAYGASGAYWIAAGGTKVIADPATITGSIGVYTGKFDIHQLAQSLGVNQVTIFKGAHAAANNLADGLAGSDASSINQSLDWTYQRFLNRVATQRRLPEARVADIAQGRVWTGTEALSNGLADALGGYGTAIQETKALLHLGNGDNLTILTASSRSDYTSLLRSFLGGGQLSEVSTLLSSSSAWDNIAEVLARINLSEPALIAPIINLK